MFCFCFVPGRAAWFNNWKHDSYNLSHQLIKREKGGIVALENYKKSIQKSLIHLSTLWARCFLYLLKIHVYHLVCCVKLLASYFTYPLTYPLKCLVRSAMTSLLITKSQRIMNREVGLEPTESDSKVHTLPLAHFYTSVLCSWIVSYPIRVHLLLVLFFKELLCLVSKSIEHYALSLHLKVKIRYKQTTLEGCTSQHNHFPHLHLVTGLTNTVMVFILDFYVEVTAS